MSARGLEASRRLWQTMKSRRWLREITYTSVGSPSGTPSEQDLTNPTPASSTSYTFDARVAGFAQSDVQEPRIMAGDRYARFPKASLQATPSTRDQVTFDGEIWSITEIEGRVDDAEWGIILRKPGGGLARG